MASLMPCNGPKACPCPVGRCAPRGVASSVHTSSQFAGLRNRPVSPPLPAPYEHTPNYPRPRPAGRDLVLRALPRGHTGNRAMGDLGPRKGVPNTGRGPDGCRCVWPPLSWRPQLPGLHQATNAKMLLPAGAWGPVSPPSRGFLTKLKFSS